MFVRSHIAITSLMILGATLIASEANADVGSGSPPPVAAACSGTSCATGTAALKGNINTKLNGEIDSGWLDKGKIKIRTHFMIAPVQGESLLSVDMPKGALVDATWTPQEKGTILVRPITESGATGTMNLRYTLIPALEASIYGIDVNYDYTELLNKIPGASLNYDSKADTTLAPWGFLGAEVSPPAPALDKSTLFSLPFDTLGIDSGIVEGSLSIQAAAKPTFKYTTKEVLFDSASVKTADGSAKINVSDADFVEVNATVLGELAVSGILDMRPVIKVDSVAGIPTFGLVKYSFSAVSKEFEGAPTPVSFQQTMIHIPLPNVKAPTAPISMGDAKAGSQASKSVTIDNTGELGAVLKIESSDPQFVVPSGEVKVDKKGKYDLSIAFKPTGDGPASATITIRSNDPDSPEQTFKVGANGADLSDDSEDAVDGKKKSKNAAEDIESKGCACSTIGSSSSSSTSGGYGVAALVGLGLVFASRRRRA